MTSNAFAPTAAVQQTLTALELEQARLYLQQTERGVAGAMKGMSDAQWKFKPAHGQWSIAQIMEHIIFVQERVLGMRREQLANAPGVPTGYDYKRVDEFVMTRFRIA